MAKILIGNDCIDIRFGLLERMMLSQRSRKLPLSSVRKVDPHPPLLDMMVHWADRGGVWTCGASRYEGHMIPSACKPNSTLAIEVDDEPQIFVELDDEPPEQVAERISRAMGSEPPPPPGTMSPEKPIAPSALALDIARMQQLADERDYEEDEEDEEAHELAAVRRRDPLMQGSLPPPPQRLSVPAPPVRLDDDGDLARLGGWLVGLGSLSLLTGTIIVAAGAIPGLLAVGAGVACGALGGVALLVVAHHKG